MKLNLEFRVRFRVMAGDEFEMWRVKIRMGFEIRIRIRVSRARDGLKIGGLGLGFLTGYQQGDHGFCFQQ